MDSHLWVHPPGKVACRVLFPRGRRHLKKAPSPSRVETMRTLLFAAPALLLAQAALAEAPAASLAQGPADPVLESLIEESLSHRPELKQADLMARAEHDRVAQAGTLSDPTLSLGMQNDGFKGIEIGKMETSFWQVMVTQPVPWPGKLSMRREVARKGARLAEASASRARLTAEADVRRAYLELLLVRDRLGLLTRKEELWTRAEALAKARYETSEGSQSDILRSQLERNRLRQKRAALDAEARTRLEALNRLRGRSLDEPLPTTATVAGLGLPEVGPLEQAVADAERRSPELTAARAEAERAEAQVDLSRRERFPDLAVTAAIMPRGGLEPMWQAGISVTLPIFSAEKASHAVKESEARAAASQGSVEAVEEVVRLRAHERQALLESLDESARLYRDGLLIQSQATADSTMSQYRVGRATFASLLEAIGGVIGDEEGYLEAIASARRVEIAAREVSLEPAAVGGGTLGGGPVPGQAGMGQGATAGAGAPAPSGGEAASSSGSM
jgi:outer membrane protein, heavy metal efflux system